MAASTASYGEFASVLQSPSIKSIYAFFLFQQWPGAGLVGDPIFDAFYASQVQLQTSAFISDDNTKPAYNALLDKIGPVVLVTHSQSVTYPLLSSFTVDPRCRSEISSCSFSSHRQVGSTALSRLYFAFAESPHRAADSQKLLSGPVPTAGSPPIPAPSS